MNLPITQIRKNWLGLVKRHLVLTFLTILFITTLSFNAQSQVAAWGDEDATWTSSTLNAGRSNYFQGEVIPFVYKLSGLTFGNTYTFNIIFDHYNNSGSRNAGGYAYITTYNLSRNGINNPPAYTPATTPVIDNSFTYDPLTGSAGNAGAFYTVNADVTYATDITLPSPFLPTVRTVAVTFTYTGPNGGNADIYWGLFLSKTGTVTDIGDVPTQGAGHWPGGSMAVNISGDGPVGNVGNNPGGGGVVDGIISGYKYSDKNKDGAKANTEPKLSNWTIYLDQNNNNVLDAGEVSTLTDINGDYSFHDLLPNTLPDHYIVREVLQTGWTQITPASGSYSVDITASAPVVANQLFGNFTCEAPTVTFTGALADQCANSTTYTLTGGSPSGGTYSGDGVTGTNNFNASSTTTGSHTITYSYTDANGCSNTATNSIMVNALPAPTISGNASACANSTGNVYTTESGMTAYSWTVTSGTITSGGGASDNTVTVTWGGSGTGDVKVNYTNGSNCTAAAQTDQSVTLNALPAPTISGNASACANSTGNVYTTESGMTAYSWTVTGGTISSGGGASDNTVTVTWGASGPGHVKVNYTNGNSCTAAAQTDKSVTINSLPAPSISGNASACANSTGNVYTTESGMTAYSWAVTGGTITSGGGSSDNTVTVTWGASSPGHVKVNYTNGSSCTAAAQTDKSVTINALPAPTISGNASACANSTGNVYTTESGMTAYSWTVTGGTITSGGGASDNTVTVTWGGSGTGHVKVNYSNENGCRAAAQTDKPVTVIANAICATYIGDYFKNTGSTGMGGSSAVTLVYNISADINSTCNNISGLTSNSFTINSDANSNVLYTGIGNTPVITYNPTLHTVTIPATISVPTNAYSISVTFTLGTTGSYAISGTCSDNPVVTVSANSDGFVTGGGFIYPANAGGRLSTINNVNVINGLKNNFGFNIKTNKAGKLQGNWNTIIRRREGNKVMVYQVKSNNASTLNVTKITSTSYRADMTFTQANFKNLTCDVCTVDANNGTVIVSVYDNGEPGAGVDQILITVKDMAGNIWYTSDATANHSLTFTNIQKLNQGNIQVHTLGAPATARIESDPLVAQAPENPAAINPGSVIRAAFKFAASAYPNPYSDNVRFTLESDVSGHGVLEVFNLKGQKIQTVFDGNVFAGRSQVIQYNVPAQNRTTLMYRFRVGDKVVSGKLVRP